MALVVTLSKERRAISMDLLGKGQNGGADTSVRPMVKAGGHSRRRGRWARFR